MVGPDERWPAAPAHHLHLCARLAERHDVVGVLHPAPRRAGARAKLRKSRTRFTSLGLTYGALHALAAVRNPWLGWDWTAALAAAEARFFPNAAADYARTGVRDVAHAVDDVNGTAAISLVRRLSPDVVVCLGGPIYRQPLIDACGTMVNFHSGISPLYNGASTIMFAFANGHARLCGGTLITTFVVTSTVDNRELMWRNKLSAVRALRDESVYLVSYNRLMREFGLEGVADGAAVMPASEAWPTERKEDLANELWARCGMPPLDEFLEEERTYFTWEDPGEWVSRGHEVGLHTATHPYCSRLRADAIGAEISEPVSLLRRRLGLEFLPFSYRSARASMPRPSFPSTSEACSTARSGSRGSRRGEPAPFRLERACIEGELAYPVFGKALLGLPRAPGARVAAQAG